MSLRTREVCRPPVLASRGRLLTMATAVGLALLITGCGGSSGVQPGPGSTPGQGGGFGFVRPGDESPGTGGRSGVSGGALFGGNAALAAEAAMLGRRLDVVRVYERIGENFPGGQNSQLMASGTTLLVSLDSNGYSYASIAAGNQDAAISAFLRSANQAALEHHLGAIYISFQHEPDNRHHRYLGSPAQFVRAWDHVHELAEAAHLDWNDGGRLHWIFILIHSSYANGQASQYWPGTGEVDAIAADGYNTYGCRMLKLGQDPSARASSAVTPASIFGPAIGFAVAHGRLPVFISEWASDSFPSAEIQAGFIRKMQAYVAANREIAAVLYWDSNGAHCRYQVNSNPASVAALAAMGHSPQLQGRLTTPSAVRGSN